MQGKSNGTRKFLKRRTMKKGGLWLMLLLVLSACEPGNLTGPDRGNCHKVRQGMHRMIARSFCSMNIYDFEDGKDTPESWAERVRESLLMEGIDISDFRIGQCRIPEGDFFCGNCFPLGYFVEFRAPESAETRLRELGFFKG
jgi:hypothetical protein